MGDRGDAPDDFSSPTDFSRSAPASFQDFPQVPLQNRLELSLQNRLEPSLQNLLEPSLQNLLEPSLQRTVAPKSTRTVAPKSTRTVAPKSTRTVARTTTTKYDPEAARPARDISTSATQRFANGSEKCNFFPNGRNNTTPSLIIHIGPRKTGTTSIQNFFTCHEDFLRRHNYYYLGKTNVLDTKKCEHTSKDFVRDVLQMKKEESGADLLYMIEYHLGMGHNVIISDEGIAENKDAFDEWVLKKIDLSIDYNPHIVATYRRYHEWIISWYRFTYGPKWYDKTFRQWNHKAKELTRPPTFKSFLESYQDKSHPIIEEMNLFRNRVGVCTDILNLHHLGEKGDSLTQFLSLLLNNDQSLVSHVTRSIKRANKSRNNAFDIDSERLALMLHDQGKVRDVLLRREVVTMIKMHFAILYGDKEKKGQYAAPLDCLRPQEESDFLTKTELTETGLFRSVGDKFLNWGGRADDLIDGFRSYVRKNSFCDVDLEKMMQHHGKYW
eukprot:CAMPEP_0172519222 /NCGR_PEP_ID=MMETSP1066-20121228/291285_1 /TAXON_ID=671091 /ORGANISM="Coscinodiscus wailesii, Strain CCMP2513" /LENGTH=495 /DNA_ID=CAMNT_0013301765 /DNA_START=300 /DNA_END=1785 /DNA_ORIENTATION=+